MNLPTPPTTGRRPSVRRDPAFVGRLMLIAGMIVMLVVTALLPGTSALAQAPQGDISSAGPNSSDKAPEAIASAGPFIYALPAKDTPYFYRYDIGANSWAKMADLPVKVQWGGALTSDGTFIYALPAKDTQLFYRYDISANTWTARANVPSKVKEGGALTYDGTYIYALTAKGTSLFYRYDIAGNSWTAMANIPAPVSKTGALITLGSYIYGLPSKDTTLFYRYDIGANSWTAMANVPVKVKEGGALTTDGTNLYALTADGSKRFYRYDVATNTWVARADLPANVSKGGSLVYDGTYIYAVRAGDSQSFYRYNIAANTWSTQANVPVKFKEGGALVYVGPGGPTPPVTLTPDNQGDGLPGQMRIYSHVLTVGNITSVFNLAVSSSQGWTTSIYEDENGNGVQDPEDDPITQTPSLGPNVAFNFLVGVTVPLVVPLGTLDTATVTATAVTGGSSASATDTTRVGQAIAVQPSNSRFAVAGSVNFYGHTVTNNTNQAVTLNITATSTQGWTVYLWEDLNRNGVHEVSNPNEPAVSNPVTLAPGETYWLVAEIWVPANAVAGTVDQTAIRADSVSQPGPSGAATDTTTVFVNDPPIIDGKYDDIYNTSPNSQVVCYNNPAGTLFGKLASFYQADGDGVYVVLAIDKDFVDNTYGTNAIGWPGGHTFGNLTGSDHAQFYGYNAAGTKVLDFKVDYLTSSSGTPSGYATLGVTGGEGRMNLGAASSILQWGTSLDYTLNDLGYCSGGSCGTLVVNSPATDAFYTPNPTYPDWIYDVIYEIKIARGAFTGGFGRVEVPYIHASPSKLGTNTIYALPGPCPGEIGDYVWHDVDRDGVQDPNEFGIDNVRLNLYTDNGDGVFNPTIDTLVGFKITSAGGKYLFQNLAAANYWVQVVESTVPAGYSTTTYNTPMLVDLDEGESYLEADFGYATPSTLDYGDAPDAGAGVAQGNYNTTDGDNGPKHTILSTLKLGNVAPDGDSGFLQNVDATADDLVNTDDEDGVAVLPEILASAGSVNLTVKAANTGAAPATLACWIDFNRNGVFENTFERTSTTIPGNSGTADYPLTFSGLSGLVAGPSYLRCRIAYASGEVANATGAAASGEVEDYKLTIGAQPDFGDAPDQTDGTTQGNYNTRASDNGPSHVIVSGLQLGAVAPDGDNGTLQNVDADADDLANTDDEDGVTTLPTINSTSTSVPLTVSVVNTSGSGATLACWIDFNRDGVFDNVTERQSTTVANQAGSQSKTLTFTGFGTPVTGVSYLRCRIANTASQVANPTGAASSGEIEDTKVTIVGLDYGDAPDASIGVGQGNYNTQANDSGPSHVIVGGLSLGSIAPDADPGTLQDVDASADDSTDDADEDGVDTATLPPVTVGSTSVALTIRAIDATASPATVACWIDFNRDGVFAAAERASNTISPATGVQFVSLTFSGYPTPVAGDSYLRCRIANAASDVTNATGAAATGEVEDYKITITAEDRDFGDAPDTIAGTATGDYNTTAADSGPSHVIIDDLYLGVVAPDNDPGTLQDGAASADNFLNINDEEGIEFLPFIDTNTREVAMPVRATNDTASPASVACWIDFNRNGSFLDAGEQSQVQTIPPNSGMDNYDMLFNGFGIPVVGDSYIRCRIAANATEVQTPTGPAQSGEVEDYLITIEASDISKLGEIGNYVWLDENSDGYQDAGEPGLPNVTVVLYGAAGLEIARTVTDNNGNYLFADLQGGTYYVDVLDGTGNRTYTLPAPGLTQTPPSTLPGEDGGNQSHAALTIPNSSFSGYRLTLLQGGENLTADFGYNTNPQSCVQTNTCTGSIGDRVWIDADGDGKQDAEEPGLGNVTVQLYYDPDGNGVYDTPYPGGSTTTDLTGFYLFDNLPPGGYVVRVIPPGGYTQSGDPDTWGSPCTTCDNQTTTPVVLGPGDVFLNADFGYQPPVSQNNTIGDKVWFDADADSIGPAGTPGGTDTSEYGIPLVTIALIKDTNNNGIWNTGEPIVATDITDASGLYLFTGLPDASYLVWVNDTDNVLGAMTSTYDSDGGGLPGSGAPLNVASSTVKGLSSVLNLGVGNASPVSNLVQDFGYTSETQQPNQGLIGDRVWLDVNADGIQDANEPGIEGIVITLIDGNGVEVGSTITDENGFYFFGNLPAGTYTVLVSPPAGLWQTYDADGPGTPNRSTVTIGAGEINLLQDFGYRGTGTVGNLVWNDVNADGNVDAGEAGIAGVTLDVYWDTNGNGAIDAGEPYLGHATTAANGSYLFSGLPVDDGGGNAKFVIDVTDDAGVLTGFWHSLGTAGADNNSQVDPYAVTLTPAAPNNLTADFGYYIVPAAVGNFVWRDNNANGLQNAGEPGIPGVVVKLTVTYPGAGSGGSPLTVDIFTTTNANGYYGFGNLLLDENTPATSGAPVPPTPPQPSFSISAQTPTGYTPTLIQVAGATACTDNPAAKCNDSNNPTGTPATPIKGQTDVTAANNGVSISSYDFGFLANLEIGDYVWLDLNYNGLQDANEPGVQDVLVTLYDGVGGVLNTTTTDADGFYLFTQTSGGSPLSAGPYEVGFTLPNGYAFTLPNVGSNDAIDSDANPTTGRTGVVNVTSDDYTFDAGLVLAGSIGNYVWVDENSDGYQDVGEPGLPNVQVILRDCTTGAILGQTFTDAQGGYLFDNLAPGTYCVDVGESTLPPGMTQSPYTLPGADFGNQNHSGNGYQVVLPPGGENLTADFGYNYNPPPCVDGDPSCTDATATIGDRVWVDSDGDGVQDPEEVGLAGILVTLYYDPDGDGVYNTPYPGGTDTTDSNGYYLFDNLPPGSYVVAVTPPGGGYTQTGDPDEWGVPCTTCDNRTTTPVVLGPGDVFLNADFGYQPPVNATGTIGNTVWLDLDADGVGPNGNGGAPGNDNNEPGIAGVTVALIRDTNANGEWNLGEPIIASDVTDANGQYLFTGLPVTNGTGTDDYLVWVNDTNNVLAPLQATYDQNGAAPALGLVTGLGISSVLDLTTTPVLDQDFGYTPTGQNPGEGLIGDRVWLDINGDGVQNANEPGIESVRVELRDSSGNVVGVTTTNEYGYYYFGGLQPGTYTVVVTPPPGMTQTYDADGLGTPHQSTVTIGGANPLINLDQDFGYRGSTLGTIGDLVWRDLNANGVVDAGETGIAGVTLDLYWDLNGNGTVDPGEPLVGSATTNANGNYLFGGLPTDDGGGNAQFVVDVTDTAGVLIGAWHSLGTAGQNNNSQTDPYAVTLTPAAPNNLTADFGYYILPGAVGNRVWLDDQEPGTLATDKNGIQNAGEPGIASVKVTLTIVYPDTTTVVVVTVTDNTGWYSFGNLLLDEDFNGTGGPEPTHTISINPSQPAIFGYFVTLINASGSTIYNDSNNPAGTVALPIEGQVDTSFANDNATISSYDFGYALTPTAVSLDFFDAEVQGRDVLLTWASLNEVDLLGFDLYRAPSPEGPWTKLNATMIAAQSPGAPQGHSYSWTDRELAAGAYWYRLDWVENTGTQAAATAQAQVGTLMRKTWMPMVVR